MNLSYATRIIGNFLKGIEESSGLSPKEIMNALIEPSSTDWIDAKGRDMLTLGALAKEYPEETRNVMGGILRALANSFLLRRYRKYFTKEYALDAFKQFKTYYPDWGEAIDAHGEKGKQWWIDAYIALGELLYGG